MKPTLALMALLFFTIEPDHDSAQQRTKMFSWDNYRSGDCEIQIHSLTITSDGMVFINAEMWTNATWFGDLWHIRFIFLNQDGNAIWTSPTIDPNTKRMFPGDRDKLHQKIFNYDSSLFDSIAKVQLIGEC